MSPFTRIPRLLLTNDDGFDAPGLAALLDVARQLSDEIWVVAPQLDQSGMGQSLSLNQPLRCIPRGDKQWSVSGTPADCVILALSHLMQMSPPTFILSGVNAGANVGDDVNLSGTLGAAFTGLMMGVPAIGISLDCASRKNVRWDTARTVLPRMLQLFLTNGWPKDTCLSINIPDRAAEAIEGYSWARTAQKTVESFVVEKREDLREKDYYWIYPGKNKSVLTPKTDTAILERGTIAVTCLALDRSKSIDLPPVRFADLTL
jgi:5'-nucleotidase